MVEDSVTTGPPDLIGTRSDANAPARTHVVYHHIEGQARSVSCKMSLNEEFVSHTR